MQGAGHTRNHNEEGKGRPAEGKERVKRILFDEGERRLSVNRRLRDQLKMKKQSLKSRHTHAT